jgi:alpha-beta hydrolase superfamily lysophospholipase
VGSTVHRDRLRPARSWRKRRHPAYAVAREIADLSALIDTVGGSAYVLGKSSGGVLALEAVLDGLPITKLACYEPPFIIDSSREPTPDDFAERFNQLVADGGAALKRSPCS